MKATTKIEFDATLTDNEDTAHHALCFGVWHMMIEGEHQDAYRQIVDGQEYHVTLEPIVEKPSWDDAPDDAEWLAQDQNGLWYFYPVKPKLGDINFWLCSSYMASDVKGKHNPDWRNTLEKRPSDTPPSFNVTLSLDDELMSKLDELCLARDTRGMNDVTWYPIEDFSFDRYHEDQTMIFYLDNGQVLLGGISERDLVGMNFGGNYTFDSVKYRCGNRRITHYALVGLPE